MDDIAGQLSLFAGFDPGQQDKSILLPKAMQNKTNAPKTKAAAVPAPVPTLKEHYGLNQEQWQAVTATERAVAVLAGPGTGKTRTLVYRIAYLLEECGVPPSHITAVTFTNKAAKEMRQRLEEYLKDKRLVRKMNIGTFHSICLHILSKWQKKTTIIDQYEAQTLAQDVIQNGGLKLSAKDLLHAVSLQKNGGTPPDSVPQEAIETYQNLLEQYQVMDYDDILLHTLQGFTEGLPASQRPGKKISQQIQAAFQHLLVDEFQDINDVQYQLLQAWSLNSTGIFAIGDPDQAIYGFRGSNTQCFQKLQADFPEVKEIRLVQNYRSTPQIIDCALPVISAGQAGQQRRLEAYKDNGAKVRLLEAKDTFTEALFVAKEINRLVGGIDMLDAHQTGIARPRTYGFADFAILYRTHRQAELIEQCLHKESIPYVVTGREDFLAEPQVRQAVSFFRFLLDPTDLVSLSCVLRSFGISSRQREKILGIYQEQALADITALVAILEEQTESDHKLAANLLTMFAAKVRKEKPIKLLESWIDENYLGGIPALEKLLHASIMHKDMAGLLQAIALGQESDLSRSGGKKYTADAVSLLTLHGAKGLEFPVVFLCGVKDGLIPFRSHTRPNDEAEERRLFYVGVTRAQDELLLLTDQTSSPFLTDINENLLQKEIALPERKRKESVQLNLFG